jgi:predicted phage terminase large subunit-like protein
MAAKDKSIVERYRALCDPIADETDIDFSESKQQQEKRIAHLKADFQAFVQYYFPHYCRDRETGKLIPAAKFHIDAANRVRKNPNIRYQAMWARGHAKSTYFNIMIPLWLMIQDFKKPLVMVLVGKSLDNAKTLISDIQAEFIENKLFVHDFGELMKYGNWEEGRFATTKGSAFFALGRGQSPRGLRHRSQRPNYIVMDDVDDDELCRNPRRVSETYDWALKALFGTMDSGQGRFIVVGNKIAQNSIISKFEENPKFYTHKVSILDSKGRPTWPEKNSVAMIEDLIATMGWRRAQGEYFHNPIVEGAVFKHEWIGYLEPLKWKDYDYIVSYCDPSFKDSSTSDYKAIITVGKAGTDLHVLACFVRKCSIAEMVRYWYDFHENLRSGVFVDYFMEANFAQDMILDEFKREGEERGYQLPLRKDIRKKPDKWARVEAISPLFERGTVHISRDIKDTEDCRTFIDQLLSFEKGSKAHDDAPDALEGAVWILNRRGRHRVKNIRSGKYTWKDNSRRL